MLKLITSKRLARLEESIRKKKQHIQALEDDIKRYQEFEREVKYFCYDNDYRINYSVTPFERNVHSGIRERYQHFRITKEN